MRAFWENEMQRQTREHLQQLQIVMQRLQLWQTNPPAPAAFISEQPFALDTMEPTEWLQWIFIPRMHALLDSGAALPSQIAVSPYLEEAMAEFEALSELLEPLRQLEELLQNQQDA